MRNTPDAVAVGGGRGSRALGCGGGSGSTGATGIPPVCQMTTAQGSLAGGVTKDKRLLALNNLEQSVRPRLIQARKEGQTGLASEGNEGVVGGRGQVGERGNGQQG